MTNHVTLVYAVNMKLFNTVDIRYLKLPRDQQNRDTGKFEALAFYKALGKSNTVFTSVLTLVLWS